MKSFKNSFYLEECLLLFIGLQNKMYRTNRISVIISDVNNDWYHGIYVFDPSHFYFSKPLFLQAVIQTIFISNFPNVPNHCRNFHVYLRIFKKLMFVFIQLFIIFQDIRVMLTTCYLRYNKKAAIYTLKLCSFHRTKFRKVKKVFILQ